MGLQRFMRLPTYVIWKTHRITPFLSQIFTPVNFDPTTKVVTRFPAAIMARYVRIIPTAYHSHMSMRFDLIDC